MCVFIVKYILIIKCVQHCPSIRQTTTGPWYSFVESVAMCVFVILIPPYMCIAGWHVELLHYLYTRHVNVIGQNVIITTAQIS